MKKKSFIIAALIIGMIACIASCKKKTTDPTPEPTPEPTEYVCTHDSLVYVAAVEPTGEENGCVEHWVCPFCLATFADAEGKTPITNTVLWATNYVIDDGGIYENNFAQYQGDESYFYRACINMPGGLGNENNLWPDYTNWQNWTEGQWQEYWNCVDSYYSEIGGEGSLVSSANIFPIGAIGAFISRVVLRQPEGIDSSIEEFFEKVDQQFAKVNGKLDTIMNKIGEIQNSLNALADKVKVDNYTRVVEARRDRQIALYNITKTPFKNILLEMENVNKENGRTIRFTELEECAPNSYQYIADLAYRWHDTQLSSGNPSEAEFKNMLDLMKGGLNGIDLPAAYDYLAEHTNGWEHEAQTVMETARAADAVLMGACYIMNMIYYYTNPEEIPYALDIVGINEKMLGYVEVLDKYNENLRHHDYLRCLIKDAEKKFDKDLIQIRMWDYLKANLNNFYLKRDETYTNLINSQIGSQGMVEEKWFTTVCQYYRDRKETDFINVLKKVGFNITQDDPIIIAWNNGGYATQDDESNGLTKYVNKFFLFGRKTLGSEDWLKFRTRVVRDLSKQPISDVDVAAGLRIKREGLDHNVEEAHTSFPHSNEFFTLKIHK